MKTSMDTDTILFIDGDGRALGMNYGWYTKNYNKVRGDFGIPERMYYKVITSMGNPVWIDFDRTIKFKSGRLLSRIQQGIEDPLMHIEVKDIPATTYYDKDGYKYQISAYDGNANSAYWVQRLDNPELKLGYTYQISPDGNHLYVIFTSDLVVQPENTNKPINTIEVLKNSMISLNGLFYPYTVIGDNMIMFPNVMDKISVTNANLTNYSEDEIMNKLSDLRAKLIKATELRNGEQNRLTQSQKELTITENQLNNSLGLTQADRDKLEQRRNSILASIAKSEELLVGYNQNVDKLSDEYHSLYNLGMRREYQIKVNVYYWDGILKDPAMIPARRTGEWFSMNREIDDNCFIVYKGQIFDYEVSTADKRLFRLKNVGLSNLEGFETTKVNVFHMRSADSTKEIRRYVIKGHTNVHKNTVEFVLPVSQSLVLYEGLDHEYSVIDDGTIAYDGTKWSPNYVVDTSNVTSVNFTPVG